jgi:hypothetical protein
MDFPPFSLIQRQGPAYIDQAVLRQTTDDVSVSAELLTAMAPYLIRRSRLRLRRSRGHTYVAGDVREGPHLCDEL